MSDITKDFIPKLVETDCDLNDRDKVYNRIARRQPAYISLMFPIIWFYIFMNETNLFNVQENIVKYIFNCILSLCIFLPALFYLYEQLIRGISEVVTEYSLFRLINPNFVLFRNNCIALDKDEKKKFSDKAKNTHKIDISVINNNQKKRRDKDLKSKIKSLNKKIRFSGIIQNNSIAFEYNCVYGFFRNLVGGTALNLIIYYVCFFTNKSYHSKIMDSFYGIAIPALWILFIVCVIFAWCSRVRQIKRECHLFIYDTHNEKDTTQEMTDN